METLVTWTGTVAAILGAFLVTSKNKTRRKVGFASFLLANVLWGAWGAVTGVYALTTQYVVFSVAAVIGIRNN